MFNRFNKDKRSDDQLPKEDPAADPQVLAFEMLILSYLGKHGIDGKGNKLKNNIVQTQEDLDWINRTLNLLGFTGNIEYIIINEWENYKIKNQHLTPKEFVQIFISDFHNVKIESVAPDFVLERNKKFVEAYKNIIVTIERIQGWLDDENLRTRIESDFKKRPKVQSTMFQCTTPFCIISIGCDRMGRYNIIYSLDYRIQEMISENFASTLIRRIYQFTSGEMESFVKIGSLYADCIDSFNKIIEESKSQPYHTIITKSKHDNVEFGLNN